MQSKNGKKDIYVFYSREHGLDFFANYSKTVIAMTVRLVAINMFFPMHSVFKLHKKRGWIMFICGSESKMEERERKTFRENHHLT